MFWPRKKRVDRLNETEEEKGVDEKKVKLSRKTATQRHQQHDDDDGHDDEDDNDANTNN